jgi:beta-glucosidase
MAGALLVATVRIDRPASGAVEVALGCGAGCSASVPVTATLAELAPGHWTRVAIPLSCFGRKGADLAHVSELFRVHADAPLRLSFSRIELGTQADHAVQCDMR